MRIWVEVIPGADAVRAALELPEAGVEPELELDVELDEHAATVSAATVMMAAACQRSRIGLIMKCLPFRADPGGFLVRPPGLAERGGWPALGRPEAWPQTRTQGARSGSCRSSGSPGSSGQDL